ncbi:MAG: helix-turn-helix domain-containing protein [Proteobacteria bacterium]|nr:MAG: helix-turn-helix domain-containing protein [Pseudomonadota bacterium]
MDQDKRGIDKAVEAAGSQQALADALGVSQQRVSQWVVRGYVSPRRAQEIEIQYGVPRRELVNPMLLDLLEQGE